MNHEDILKIIPVNIHPIWLIEENARIFRVEVCAKPPKAPITADRETASTRINFLVFLSRQAADKIKGANFCQIRMIRLLIH